VTRQPHTAHILRREGRYWAAALAVACQFLAGGRAGAEPPGTSSQRRVLIVVDAAGDALLNRVVEEISAIPEVEIVMRPPVATLDEDARSEHAKAAIRKLASGMGVEVWMADATTGRSLIRQIIIDESREGPDQSLVALQAAELLRTSLFLAREATRPAATPPPSPLPVVLAAPAPRAHRNALLAGVGPLYSRGGVSPALQVWLSYERLWSRGVGLALDLSAPLARGTIAGTEGSAELGAVMAGGGLLARWRSDRGHLTAAASIGGAFAAVLVTGRPVPSLVGESTSAYTGLAYVRLDGAWNPAQWLGLGVAGMVGTTTSRVRVQFADRNAGEWGMPLAAAVLFCKVDWQ
jgi:hypothetical protein